MSDFLRRAEGMVAAMKRNGERPGRWRVSVDLSSAAYAAENRRTTVTVAASLTDSLAMRTLDVDYPDWWVEPNWPVYGRSPLRVIATDWLMGIPVTVDRMLPPRSLILEPVA